ncbi:MAG TPA: hypothetical protein DIW61_10570 [Candidatus Aminicenantes bacterium]|nr:hypothetical protein [Candidatus Aminicenantes bacterium]
MVSPAREPRPLPSPCRTRSSSWRKRLWPNSSP